MSKNQYIAPQGIYLLSHSVGLLPKNAQSQLQQAFFDPWVVGNEDVWPNWISGIEAFRSELATLFNSEAGNFCPQNNVSSAVTKFIYSLPQEGNQKPYSGKTILLSEEDFPSVAYTLKKTESSGYTLKFIPAKADTLDLNVWDEYMSPDVGLVLVTHVQSNNGKQLPVAEITALARSRGALSMVDIAQSAGVMPIDFQRWQPDVVVGSCVKWTCGGPGAAYIWVNSDLIDQCQPLDVGWFSHENPFEFDIHDFRYASDALRFWGGTPSVMPFALAAGSLKMVNATGINQIRAHNLRLSQKVIDAVDEKHVVSPIEADQRGGTLVLNFGDHQDQVIERLRAAQVHFDSRATGIRLSTHIYNTDEEIDLLVNSCLF